MAKCLRIPHIVCVATLATLFVSCARTPTPAPTPASLTVSGSSAMTPLLALLAERFEAGHPSITVIIDSGNSAQGMAEVADGSAALGALSVPAPQGAWAAPESAWAAPIAVDGIAIVVHPDNPLENLTLMQLYDIFYGRVWHWSELRIKVAADEIAVVSREEGSGTRAVFEALVMTRNRTSPADCEPVLMVTPGSRSGDDALPEASLCEGDPVTSMAVVMLGSAAVIEFVATHPGAIGYVSHGTLSAQARWSVAPPQSVAAAQVRAVHVEDVPPDPKHIADGSYYLSRPFFLVALQEPTGSARLFVDFCLSAEGQATVAQQYLPVRER